MSIMLNLDVKKIVHEVIFIDCNNVPYFFHGRLETNNRDLCVAIIDFCNTNNIACNYIYRNKKKDKFSVVVTPYSVEEAWVLFHQPFMTSLFSVDYSIDYSIKHNI